ncbi:hypothetical protein SAMN05421788_10361 [Filimonas lacunae]|uniref:Uncharacterized protein n=1 Tax=Filimonas lacunae TaxID=477680 RepID=A0A173MJX3_9BACT|nr:hypothetical protein [Filimonas lacunae]BAV07711.1 hypothetical protein FLA_3742 [Filimonas lacunae]SIT03879.1 hypothetical protein SAMN05421788_10361 [Filimonas lacunae]
MTKDEFYKNYLEDPLLIEKNYITPEKIQQLKFHQSTGVKLLEIIKIAVDGCIDGESEAIIARKMNQNLNKESGL